MRHRFDAFGYCPVCGEAYTDSSFDPTAVMFLCAVCGFEFYQHSVPAATAVVPSAADHSQILLITRRTPPKEGLLALPGGILRHAEHPSAAAIRETAEETTLTPTVSRLLCATQVQYVYRGDTISVLELAFLMRPVVVDLRSVCTLEAASLEFVDVEAILRRTDALAFPEQASVLRAYRRSLRTAVVH